MPWFFYFVVASKILLATEELMIMYNCQLSSLNDIQCGPDNTEIRIRSRHRDKPFNEPTIHYIKDIIRTQTCIDPELFEILPIPRKY